MKAIKKLLSLTGAAVCAGLISTHGAILVEPTGTGTNSFTALPAVEDWSTLGAAGNAAAYTVAATLDADIIANTLAADVATVLGQSSTQPPSVSNVARRNSNAAGNYIQTRPNNAVAYILLMATLQNNTGGAVNFLNVSYTLGTAMGAGIEIGEEIPGLRGYYSMTGDPGSWVQIPQFTTATPGEVSASLDVGGWANGATMYVLWADDEASTHNTGTSQEGAYTIDNFHAEPSAGRDASLTGFFGNGNGWTAQLLDGTGTLAVNQSTIAATVNGTAATPLQITKTGDNYTISYVSPTALPSDTTNTVVITFNDTSAPAKTYTVTRSLIVEPYVVIPATSSVAGVDTTSSGFKARMHQIGVPRAPGDRNSIANAEKQFVNGFIDPATNDPYPNLAADPGTPDGAYAIPTVINWNQDAPADAGNFGAASTPAREDAPFPGIDIFTNSDDIVSEMLTFLELKAGVVYRMGVNSDDGFKVTVGKNPRDVFSMILGSFNTGRAATDTTFDFMVEADGIYPFRLLWWEGTGGAAVEWFTVQPDGTKILVNDREIAGHVKAYSTGPTPPLYVESVSPYPGETNAPGALVIEITLEDAATAVNSSSVKLFVNDVDVTSSATVTKAAGSTETKITYDPPGVLTPETALNVRLEFADNAATPVTRTVNYTIKVKPQVLVALDDTQIWKYNRTGDDLGTEWREYAYVDTDPVAWQEGAPLIADDSSAVEPIRTPISRFRDSDGTHITTYYFRTHFNFAGNPAAVNLLLRHVVDDGVVFYLNGVEIHRFGTSTNTVVTAATFFTGHENVWEGPFLVPRASLRNGDNVLAAEVHQSDGTSSDVVFGAELYVVNDPTAGPARIAAVAPVTGSSNVSSNAVIDIQLEDGTTAVVQNSIKLTVNGAVVSPTITKPAGGILTRVMYTPSAPYTPEQVINAKIEFTDTAGAVRSQDFTFTIEATYEVIFGIDDTRMWRYLNTGEDAGTAWREKAFDDSTWPEGPAMLAAETGATVEPIRTTLSRVGPDGTTQIITDYFRTHFNFTGDPATARLQLRHAVDDGAIFYLNGQEIHRFYFEQGIGDITYTNLAGVNFTPGDHENRWEGPFVIPTTALVQGDNVIAVEVHQNGPTSSDVVFGMELQRITSGSQQPVETRFTSATLQADGSIRIQWTGPGTLEEASTVDGTWAPISNAPNPYTATTAGNMKFYRVKQ
jgi:hypothetical protein